MAETLTLGIIAKKIEAATMTWSLLGASATRTLAIKQKPSPSLTVINAIALQAAIDEFIKLGRAKFLRQYGFSRSSKFYLIHDEKIFDTKALLAAAYRHATSKRLTRDDFSGGRQTTNVLRRLADADPTFSQARVFEDRLGELRNLFSEYDRIPRSSTDVRELGFSNWIPLKELKRLQTSRLPGVYVIASSSRNPGNMSIVDRRVVYMGETVEQNLDKRLDQLRHALRGKGGSSGGTTLRRKKCHRKKLWLSIRSFPLGYGLDPGYAKALRSSQIRSLERTLLHEYVRKNQRYPDGNSK